MFSVNAPKIQQLLPEQSAIFQQGCPVSDQLAESSYEVLFQIILVKVGSIRKEDLRTPTVVTPAVDHFIRMCLEMDQEEGLRKQKHTAKRIYDRLVSELGFTGSSKFTEVVNYFVVNAGKLFQCQW